MHNTHAITQRIEQFVSVHGDDPFISKTIHKMLAARLAQSQKELKAVQASLKRLERAYGKSSERFMLEYLDGTAGDEMDWIEWASLVKMRDRLLAEQAALRGS